MPSKYWQNNFRISSWTPHLCGIRITNATVDDTGYWRLTSSDGSEITRGVARLIVQGSYFIIMFYFPYLTLDNIFQQVTRLKTKFKYLNQHTINWRPKMCDIAMLYALIRTKPSFPCIKIVRYQRLTRNWRPMATGRWSLVSRVKQRN